MSASVVRQRGLSVSTLGAASVSATVIASDVTLTTTATGLATVTSSIVRVRQLSVAPAGSASVAVAVHIHYGNPDFAAPTTGVLEVTSAGEYANSQTGRVAFTHIGSLAESFGESLEDPDSGHLTRTREGVMA